MTMFEDQFIYFPDAAMVQTPAASGLEFEEHRFRTADGAMLNGWFMSQPEARATVLHCHGNAGNISHRLSLYERWHAMGLSVFAFDYRGYGNSAGKPSEAGLYDDARAAWRYLTNDLGTPPASIVISGRSLGAAVAAKLAGEVEAAALVLETPFTNIPEMAAVHYPWLPLRWLAKSRFDTLEMVADIHLPKLIIAARDDAIVPLEMTKRIYSAAQEPKHYVMLPGGHNNFDAIAEEYYLSSWRNWLNSVRE